MVIKTLKEKINERKVDRFRKTKHYSESEKGIIFEELIEEVEDLRRELELLKSK